MNEREIVARVHELFSDRIGDDAAIVGDQVITTDMLVEDVDFTSSTPVQFIARKSLSVNLSDLAAMGATPLYAVVGLAIPEWVRPSIDRFLVAMRDAAKEWGIEIVGGDLSRAEKFVVSVTAIGRVGHRPLLRSGARPGDRIYLSRPVGGSGAGLTLLQNGWTLDGPSPRPVGFAQRELALSAMRRQVDPDPEIALGTLLSSLDAVTACIDVSDGLSTDLHHLCRASRCGAELERQRIPVFPDLAESGAVLGINVREVVLHGGEEYALLFTARLRESEMSALARRPVYAIGRIISGEGVTLIDGESSSVLEARGWDHFA